MVLHLPATRALQLYDAAARHLNFTRAAEEVGLTPAAVSYQIKEFEDQLGVALFARTSRTMRLTPAGAILHEAVADSLESLHRAASRARRLVRGEARLRVSADPVMASSWLMPRVEEFRRDHPGIELRFDISHDRRDFNRDDIDIAIRFGGGVYDGSIAHRLFGLTIIPVCAPALLQYGPPISKPADLAGYRLAHIEWVRPGIVWPNWTMWMAAAGVPDFDRSDCVVFNESTQLMAAALAGSVVALVDQRMVSRDLAAGRLVRPFELGIDVPSAFAYFVVYPEASAADPRIIAFRDWILSQAND